MGDDFGQTGHGVRFEWGPEGARELAGRAACLVVVDVLSFTTSVTVAADAGTRVIPYRWRDDSAVGFAERAGAALAVGRRAVSASTPWTLSPAALRRAPFTPRLVLPSPNGSAIAAACAEAGHAETAVVAASLRNAGAVGRWLGRQGYGSVARPVAVIAAGERRADGSLRPALEDLLGAGAVIGALASYGGVAPSPEAAATAAAFAGTSDVAAAVQDSASGRELTSGGFAEDVAIAVEREASRVVPVLTEGAFTDVA
ncbi:2-phosphosulfolactate phosphatase [Streptomyces sp. NPDC050418]|uniref:2-phosphosulfolactate phosphatase n=1 Tax=Streptomyces sp. NPDC050418 TaxID=3365612 RepID=UPI0037A67CAD